MLYDKPTTEKCRIEADGARLICRWYPGGPVAAIRRPSVLYHSRTWIRSDDHTGAYGKRSCILSYHARTANVEMFKYCKNTRRICEPTSDNELRKTLIMREQQRRVPNFSWGTHVGTALKHVYTVLPVLPVPMFLRITIYFVKKDI